MTSEKPDTDDYALRPLLGILATTNIALDSLVGGLRDMYPEFEEDPGEQTGERDMTNTAHGAIAVAKALQAIVERLSAAQLNQIYHPDDYSF